ncbi:MAG: leucine-rich repeat domain-containing protein [Armatimonadetes bacterium]|nr:leucine-rich repeat domain-containing protein [Armatimonadota bacterium]
MELRPRPRNPNRADRRSARTSGCPTLTRLTTLRLSDNRLERLPNVGRLTALKELDLSRNRLRELPEAIGSLAGSIPTRWPSWPAPRASWCCPAPMGCRSWTGNRLSDFF